MLGVAKDWGLTKVSNRGVKSCSIRLMKFSSWQVVHLGHKLVGLIILRDAIVVLRSALLGSLQIISEYASIFYSNFLAIFHGHILNQWPAFRYKPQCLPILVDLG